MTPEHRRFKPRTILALSIVIFLFSSLVVGYGPFKWASNSECFVYIGCNAGFFGFDWVIHFLSGIVVATSAIWFFDKFPKFSIFTHSFLKNLIILLAICTLVGVFWEFGEFAIDQARMLFVHHSLPQTMLLQQSNTDTMGDLFADFLGALFIALIS